MVDTIEMVLGWNLEASKWQPFLWTHTWGAWKASKSDKDAAWWEPIHRTCTVVIWKSSGHGTPVSKIYVKSRSEHFWRKAFWEKWVLYSSTSSDFKSMISELSPEIFRVRFLLSGSLTWSSELNPGWYLKDNNQLEIRPCRQKPKYVNKNLSIPVGKSWANP